MNHRMRLVAAALPAGLLIFGHVTASAQGNPAEAVTDSAVRAEGIWKAAVPLTQMQGQFDNFDPVGVAAGARIKADCSINWINPDDGSLYCFASGTSLEFFLDSPHASIERARAGWRKLGGSRAE